MEQRSGTNRNTTAIFEGLSPDALEEIFQAMELRRFDANETVCREGESGKSLYVVKKGLLEVLFRRPGGIISVALLQEGDVIGELSVLVDEPRTADVVARTPVELLELDEAKYARFLKVFPRISINLNRILIQRLRASTIRLGQERAHREIVALVFTKEAQAHAPATMDATKAVSRKKTVAVRLGQWSFPWNADWVPSGVEPFLSAKERALDGHELVLVGVGTHEPQLALLLQNVDRTVFIGHDGALREFSSRLTDLRIDIEVCATSKISGNRDGIEVVHSLDPQNPEPDLAWLGRHLSRTKLGLALGAGGARGYAHLGVLEVLEEYGFVIDYLAGSSIGALIGYLLASGMCSREINTALQDIFKSSNVREMLRMSLDGRSAGLEHVLGDLRQWTRGHSFSDLRTPLIIMTADLNAKRPVAIDDGPIFDAVYAAMAVPGLVPPFERGSQLLVDALTLVPVPTAAVRDAGADITIAINLLSRDTLPAWPGETPQAGIPRRRRMRMLDILMESLDMLQLDTSVRHAAEADLVITPRFGPCTWRDYHYADRFRATGESVAREQLPYLTQLVNPRGTLEQHGLNRSLPPPRP